jgi:hypothetical protein
LATFRSGILQNQHVSSISGRPEFSDLYTVNGIKMRINIDPMVSVGMQSRARQRTAAIRDAGASQAAFPRWSVGTIRMITLVTVLKTDRMSVLPGTAQAATDQDKYVQVQFTENNEISRSGSGNLNFLVENSVSIYLYGVET